MTSESVFRDAVRSPARRVAADGTPSTPSPPLTKQRTLWRHCGGIVAAAPVVSMLCMGFQDQGRVIIGL
jgi:hypothetical protein